MVEERIQLLPTFRPMFLFSPADDWILAYLLGPVRLMDAVPTVSVEIGLQNAFVLALREQRSRGSEKR